MRVPQLLRLSTFHKKLCSLQPHVERDTIQARFGLSSSYVGSLLVGHNQFSLCHWKLTTARGCAMINEVPRISLFSLQQPPCALPFATQRSLSAYVSAGHLLI